MIEDKNPQRTPLSELGEFKLIEHLTEQFKINQTWGHNPSIQISEKR